jgi:hypothetical protein
MRYKAYVVGEAHGASLGAEPRVLGIKDISPGSYIDEDDDLQVLQERCKNKFREYWPSNFRFTDTLHEDKFNARCEETKKENTKMLLEYLSKNKNEIMAGNPTTELMHRRVHSMLSCHPIMQGINLQLNDVSVDYGMYTLYISVPHNHVNQIVLRNCFPV